MREVRVGTPAGVEVSDVSRHPPSRVAGAVGEGTDVFSSGKMMRAIR